MNSTRASAAKADPALKKVAQQFEAIFLRQMIGSMRQAKLTDDPLDSSATDNFRELADAKTADSIAALGRFGIAQMIERQLGKPGVSK
ncbi:MAG TPA: rod-binding protein [Sphingomicrobium sp.]|nr:rod-binding protein [Sphingomicrobium sp.]